MTYLEILNKVNAYMDSSGIRHFCRNQCSGSCCDTVANYTCTPYLVIRCESRLPCSLFICDYVEAHIINRIEEGLEIVDLLREIDRRVSTKLRQEINHNNIYIVSSDDHLNLEFDLSDLNLLILDNPPKIWGE